MTKYYVDNGVPLIRNSDIKENIILCEDMINLAEDFAYENQDKKLKLGDVVTVHTGDICTSAVIEENLVGSHGFATLHSTVMKNVINNYYLSWYLNSEIAKRQAYSFSTGDGRNNLNLKDFVKILIPVPNKLDEQLQIVNILNETFTKVTELDKKREKLQQLKKGLMQQLLTGKIRVKVD